MNGSLFCVLTMMTLQPFAHRKLFTRRDLSSLQEVLHNEDGCSQYALYDLDGSIHKGIYPSLRGIAHADLALYLTFHIPLSHLFTFVCENIKIFFYERNTLAHGVSPFERERHTKYLVESFHDILRELVPPELLYRAAEFLPKLRYPYAQEVISLIRGKKALISCGSQEVLESYGRFLGIDTCLGNPVFPIEDTYHPKIYGAGDKEYTALYLCREADRVIALGDTDDDLGLARAAKLISQESIVIALHGRSEALEAEADIIASSWKDLFLLLEGH